MGKLKAARTGMITGLALVLLTLFFFYVLKWPLFGNEQYVIYAVYTAGILWSLLSFRKINGDDKKFKEFFSAGFKTFIVVTLIMVVFYFIYFKFFNTAYKEEGIAINNQLLAKEGNHTAVEIEENANQLRKIFMPMMLGITTFRYLVLGALVTAVGTGFILLKKNNNK